MGYHKDTNVWYKHDVSEGAFTGTVQVIDDALLPSKSFSYADKAGRFQPWSIGWKRRRSYSVR